MAGLRLALVASEGQHDVVFVPRLLEVSGWRRRIPTVTDHESIRRLVPLPPRPTGQESWLVKPAPRMPVFLSRGDDWVVVMPFGGLPKLLSELAGVVDQCGAALSELVVFADADDTAVVDRERALDHALRRRWQFRSTAGEFVAVEDSIVRVGLWVWPDNSRAGSFDDALVDAAALARPSLLNSASSLIAGQREFDGMTTQDRKKAKLGILAQPDAPAANLPASLKGHQWWLHGAPQDGPFAATIRFLSGLLPAA